MKIKLVFLLVISTLIFSCKKANDCEKCYLYVTDNNGNETYRYTKDDFLAIRPNASWCDFANASVGYEATDKLGNSLGTWKKSCK